MHQPLTERRVFEIASHSTLCAVKVTAKSGHFIRLKSAPNHTGQQTDHYFAQCTIFFFTSATDVKAPGFEPIPI